MTASFVDHHLPGSGDELSSAVGGSDDAARSGRKLADTSGKPMRSSPPRIGRSKPLEGNRGARLSIDGMTQTRAMRKAATSSAGKP